MLNLSMDPVTRSVISAASSHRCWSRSGQVRQQHQDSGPCRHLRSKLGGRRQTSNPARATCTGQSLRSGCAIVAAKTMADRRSTLPYSQAASVQQQTGPDISQLSLELQSKWDHQKNAHLDSIVIKPKSSRKVHWICSNCPDGHLHQWQATVQSCRGCPYCSGRAVCGHNSLARKAPHIAKEWDTNQNVESPHDYRFSSHRSVHWICPQGHHWQARIYSRTKHKNGCPTCASVQRRQKQPVLTASPSSIMQYWDWGQNAKEGLDPNKLTCGSNRKAYFKCSKCPQLELHQWTACIYSVARGAGCPFCDGKRVCKCNSLQTLRPDLTAEWCHAKNQGTPDDYTARSHAVVWWENDKQGVWKTSIDGRSHSSP